MRLEEEMGRVIDALAAGQAARRAGAGWALGAATLDPAVTSALIANGLVAIERSDLLLTPASRDWRRSAASPRRRRLAEKPLDRAEPAPASARKATARSATVNLAEAPLGWLRARGLVSGRQFEAGERLLADWTRAQLAPRTTMRWDPAPSATGARGAPEPIEPGLGQIAAKARFDAALAAAGPGLADVLWRVACAGEGLEAAERSLGWPARAGKVVLLIALDRIADHYRLP